MITNCFFSRMLSLYCDTHYHNSASVSLSLGLASVRFNTIALKMGEYFSVYPQTCLNSLKAATLKVFAL